MGRSIGGVRGPSIPFASSSPKCFQIYSKAVGPVIYRIIAYQIRSLEKKAGWEMGEAEERNELFLCGCCIMPGEDPDWHCFECEYECTDFDLARQQMKGNEQ